MHVWTKVSFSLNNTTYIQNHLMYIKLIQYVIKWWPDQNLVLINLLNYWFGPQSVGVAPAPVK